MMQLILTEYRPEITWNWMHGWITGERISSRLESFRNFDLPGTLIRTIGEAAEEYTDEAGKSDQHNSLNKTRTINFPSGWGTPAPVQSQLKSLKDFEEPNIIAFPEHLPILMK